MEIIAKLICKLDAKKEQERPVFATLKSIGRQEFFEAGKAGLRPSFILEIPLSEYKEETIVEINKKRYGIYRTYFRESDETIELYCEKKAGIYDG